MPDETRPKMVCFPGNPKRTANADKQLNVLLCGHANDERQTATETCFPGQSKRHMAAKNQCVRP